MAQILPPWKVPLNPVDVPDEIVAAANAAIGTTKRGDDTIAEARGKKPTPYLGSGAHFERMTPQARILRENFVSEYMFDFDGYQAALRCGFKGTSALKSAKRLLAEPGVQRLIRERQQEFREAAGINRDQIIGMLMREANDRGHGGSASARVTAIVQAAKILGIGPEDTLNVKTQGGVMIVPAIPSPDDWEKSASASQSKLKADVSS